MSSKVNLPSGAINIINSCSGIHIPLRDYGAVSFVSHVSSGDQVLTLRESIDGSSEQLLAVIDQLYSSPSNGGTWTSITQTAASAYTHADATNGVVVFTVRTEDLSDGFDSVELTADSGTVHAVLHDGKHMRDAENLLTNVT